MGCIEMSAVGNNIVFINPLNNNMGCIEKSFRDEDETEKVLVE